MLDRVKLHVFDIDLVEDYAKLSLFLYLQAF